MNITLARALKIKNILAGKLAKVQSTIQLNNSVIEGTEQPDINALLERQDAIVRYLLDLKCSIDLANQPIRRDIYTLAEVKSGLSFWSGINTRNGDTGQFQYGTTQKTIYKAVVTEAVKEAKIAEFESLIETLQEKLDQHNYTTTIEVDTGLLNAAGVSVK